MPDPKRQIDDDLSSDRFLTQIYDLLAAPDVRTLTELIEAKQNELGLSTRQVSQILNLTRPSLDRITNGEAKKLDVLTVLKLNQFLGLGVDDILKVFAAHMTAEDVRELERTRAATFIAKTFDLPKLKQIGIIESTADLEHVWSRLLRFFGLRDILDYERQVATSLFSRTKRPFSDRMLELWVKSAYKQFERINNPHAFDPATLRELVPQIRQYTRYMQRGLLTVARALYRAGITVIIQTYLPNTSIRGGTFVINGKPCIALTNRGRSYPTIWFTLLHELAHVIFHWDKLQSLKFHITGSDDLFLVEEEADYFAREILFPADKLNYIRSFIDVPGIVYKYAEESNVHPSLVYAFYAWERHREGDKTAFRDYQEHMPSADICISALRSHPWDKDSVYEEADRLRDVLNSTDTEDDTWAITKGKSERA